MNNTLNSAKIGFCISEKNGLYINNIGVIGFHRCWYDGHYVIKLYTANHAFVIYEHNDTNNLEFNKLSKKIIERIMNSIRYDITINVDVDKIIEEVMNNA